MTQVLLLLSLIPVFLRPDAYWLARCIQGELSGNFYIGDRDTVGRWVGHTIVNRSQKEWWPGGVEGVVKDACHGYTNAPTLEPWAVALALRAMTEPDPTDGALFFLSGHDLRAHGWSGDSIGNFIGAKDFSFHFFKEWPE